MRFSLRALCLSALAFSACNDASSTLDSGVVASDSGVVTADGGRPTPRHYVLSELTMPTSNSQARASGLDLNGDGTIDNQFGMISGTLAGQGLDVSATQTAIDRGQTTVLLDVITPDFATAAFASVRVLAGSNPMPAACDDAGSCRRHLDGGASFTVVAATPEPALQGSIDGGTLNAGPGDLTLPLSIFGSPPMLVQLKSARVRLSGLGPNGVDTGVLAGGLTAAELDTKVYPAIQASAATSIASDCNAPSNPPGCGCTASSTGKTMLGLFDAAPKDCVVTITEIKTNSLITALFAPDVSVDGGGDLLSFGVAIKAVKGTYIVEGE